MGTILQLYVVSAGTAQRLGTENINWTLLTGLAADFHSLLGSYKGSVILQGREIRPDLWQKSKLSRS